MNRNEENENSLPYIDDQNGECDEIKVNRSRYSLSIQETYRDKNRNIEIKNQSSDEFGCDSLSPVAPLAEENDLTDGKVSDLPEDEADRLAKKVFPAPTVMRVIVRGCNSTISIQGLDNRSSITYNRRKSEKKWPEKEGGMKRNKENVTESPPQAPQEKSRRRKWKMLTKSLISKSIRCDKRGLDERYPKYVLLKNEEDEEEEDKTEKSTKIVRKNCDRRVEATDGKLAEKKTQKQNSNFRMKRPFKNKTNPMNSEQEIVNGIDEDGNRKSETDESLEDEPNDVKKRTKKKKIFTKEKRKTSRSTQDSEPRTPFDLCRRSSSRDQVFNEIQGVLEEALKLYPGSNVQDGGSITQRSEKLFSSEIELQETFSGTPSQFCPFSNRDCGHFCPAVPPPLYISLCNSYGRIGQTCDSATQTEDELVEAQNDLRNLQFGILSTAFPSSVVIMKTCDQDCANEEDYSNLRNDGKTGRYV